MCKRVVALTFAGNIYLMKVCIPIVNFIYVGYLEFNIATIFVFAYPTHAQLQMNVSFLILYPVLVLLEHSGNGIKVTQQSCFQTANIDFRPPREANALSSFLFLTSLTFGQVLCFIYLLCLEN